jgi:hypothetical protein
LRKKKEIRKYIFASKLIKERNKKFMKIRKATLKDKKAISELYYQLHPIEEKERKEKGFLVPIEKSKIKNILLVAQENKKIVGFIFGTLYCLWIF